MGNPNSEKNEIIQSKADADLARFSSSAIVKWGLDFQKVLQKQNLIGVLRSIWMYCKEAFSIETFSVEDGNWKVLDDFCAIREVKIDDVVYTYDIPVRERIATFLIQSARLLVTLGGSAELGLKDQIEDIANSDEFCSRTRVQATFVLALLGRQEWAAQKVFQIMKDDVGTGYGNEFDQYLMSIELPLSDSTHRSDETAFIDLRFDFWLIVLDILERINFWTEDMYFGLLSALDSDVFPENSVWADAIAVTISCSISQDIQDRFGEDSSAAGNEKVLSWNFNTMSHAEFFVREGKSQSEIDRGLHSSSYDEEEWEGAVVVTFKRLVEGIFLKNDKSNLDNLFEKVYQSISADITAYARLIPNKEYDDQFNMERFDRQIVCSLFLCLYPETRLEGIKTLVDSFTRCHSDLQYDENVFGVFDWWFAGISKLGYDSRVVDLLLDTIKKDVSMNVKLLLCLETAKMMLEENND
jgi:hypothetical protein